MPGLDRLFTLIDPPASGVTSAVTRVALDPAHELFSGHFPGHPVVPGVVLVHISLRIVSAMVGASMRIDQARAIKFLAPVDPRVSRELIFRTTLGSSDGTTRADAQAITDGTIVMKMTASVVPDEG